MDALGPSVASPFGHARVQKDPPGLFVETNLASLSPLGEALIPCTQSKNTHSKWSAIDGATPLEVIGYGLFGWMYYIKCNEMCS